jgi:hypothetical protein
MCAAATLIDNQPVSIDTTITGYRGISLSETSGSVHVLACVSPVAFTALELSTYTHSKISMLLLRL